MFSPRIQSQRAVFQFLFFKSQGLSPKTCYTLFMNQSNQKILIVEDEPDISSALQSYLGRRGFQVSTTASGTEALQMIEITKPGIVVLDFSLNDLNGQEVLRKLRETDHHTEVIVITGQMLPHEEVDRICEMGVAEYFHKPVILERLGAVISRITGHDLKVRQEHLACQVIRPPEPCTRKDFHKLVNLLGVIRNKCENFLLNKEEGFYKEKESDELLQMSTQILQNITSTVDDALDIVDRMRQGK